MKRHALLGPLLLCTAPSLGGCGLFAGPNWMTAKGDLPFALGKVESALWIEEVDNYEDQEAYGRGTLLLTDADVDCDDLLDDSFDDDGDGIVWEASGIVASARYSAWALDGGIDADDYGFEGQYWTGVDVDVLDDDVNEWRYWYEGVFGEGMVFETYSNKGLLEITEHDDDEVIGRLDTSLYRARFQAENCGEPDDDDYGYYGYYGRPAAGGS